MRTSLLRWFGCGLLLTSTLFGVQSMAAEKASAAKAAAPGFSQIVATHKLRVGTFLSAPYAMAGKDGTLIGSEVDIAQQLGRDMGVAVEIKPLAWDQLIPALQNGDIDIIVAGFSITPERALQVYFSNPYSSSGISIATNTKLTANFSSIENLNRADVAIGVIGGTVSEEAARQVFPKASIKLFSEEAKAEEALVKGLLHGYVRAEPVPRFLALKYPKDVDVPIAKPLVATREAFAVRRGDHDFINYLNAWIVAREADVWLMSTHKYWFESLSWQSKVAQ
jgi:polar amino acid transport system substrate-binding protein